ncbi:MAG: NAD(P)-dependent oxidoreductase [Cyanophyceae cyanobacterium]
MPLAGRLLETGAQVVVWNRTGAKAQSLRERGAITVDSVATALERSEVAIAMVSDGAALREILLTAARSALAGKTIIQMGTIAPDESRAIAAEVIAAGGEYLEAPVLGSIPEAKQGTLLLMVGATAEQFARWRPLLQSFGPEPLHAGPVGAGATLKLAMNQLIVALTTGFAASLGLVQREGVPVEAFLNILRSSALYAPTFDKKLQRMLDRNFDNPNFPTKHLLKDANLFASAAEAAGVDARAVVAAGRIIEGAIAQGHGNGDYSAIFDAICPKGWEKAEG